MRQENCCLRIRSKAKRVDQGGTEGLLYVAARRNGHRRTDLMDGIATGESRLRVERHCWAFFHSVGGDLRYISHRDMMRMFRRALVRAELPVRFSEGFNPHPRIMIPLPRPVGVASDSEAVVVEFDAAIDPVETLHRLDEFTPAGIHMKGARRVASVKECVPRSARYRLEMEGQDREQLSGRVREVLSRDVVTVERRSRKDGSLRSVDIREYIMDMRILECAVEFTLRITGRGTARPAEIAGILGLEADTANHRIRRVEVQWHQKRP